MKHVAVVGASGAVGERMIRLLEERRFPLASIKFLASPRSAGKTVKFRGEDYPILELSAGAFAGVEIVLSSTPASVSRQWSPIAAAAGAVVVDNSSAFRMDPDVPLVVPEVNPHDIRKHRGIIANPNCSTIQMVVALKPLHDAARVRTRRRLDLPIGLGRRPEGHPRARSSDRGPCQEGSPPCPVQVRASDPRQLHPPDRRLLAERIHQGRDEDGERDPQDHGRRHDRRQPDLRARAGADVAQRVDPGRDRAADHGRRGPLTLGGRPGVTVIDDPLALAYPLAAAAAGKDDVFVGRIRQDLHRPNTLLFWCVSDNLRKGAATNAVQIAEKLIELTRAAR